VHEEGGKPNWKLGRRVPLCNEDELISFLKLLREGREEGNYGSSDRPSNGQSPFQYRLTQRMYYLYKGVTGPQIGTPRL